MELITLEKGNIENCPQFIKELLEKYNPDIKSSFYIASIDFEDDFDKNKFSTDSSFFSCSNKSPIVTELNTQFLESNEDSLPIIFVSTVDLLDKKVTSNRDFYYFPQSLNFLECSIWFYYLPLTREGDNEEYGFEQRLEAITENIGKNTESGLYRLDIAKENFKLSLRLFFNSYLEGNGRGHDEHVAPFRFHSRTDIIKKKDGEIKELKAKKMKFGDLPEWNILLVDDYDITALKTEKGCDSKTKMELIKDILSLDTNITELLSETFDEKPNDSTSQTYSFWTSIWQYLNGYNSRTSMFRKNGRVPNKSVVGKVKRTVSNTDTDNGICTITVTGVNNSDQANIKENESLSSMDDDIQDSTNYIIWKALKKISSKTYDIILLDYLLGDSPGRQRREYSVELLLIIDNLCKQKNGYKIDDFNALIKHSYEHRHSY